MRDRDDADDKDRRPGDEPEPDVEAGGEQPDGIMLRPEVRVLPDDAVEPEESGDDDSPTPGARPDRTDRSGQPTSEP